MKFFLASLTAMLLFGVGAQKSVGATRDMDVEFPNADRPGVLKVVSGEGDVAITGYNGKVVVISAESSDESAFEENEKAKGLKRISGTRFNVSTNSDENAIIIARPMTDAVDLDIKVPRNTSLIIGGPVSGNTTGLVDLPNMVMRVIEGIVTQRNQIALNPQGGGFFNGDIDVEQITGDMEISTLDGNVTLSDVSGSALVESLAGDVKAIFLKFSGDKPLAFSTIDGDVDVTLPSNIKATITASNVDGDVYTDFDIDLVQKVGKNDPDQSAMSVNPGAAGIPDKYGNEEVKINMVFMGMPSNAITGEINGGGVEILMKTIDGDIFLRKSK